MKLFSWIALAMFALAAVEAATNTGHPTVIALIGIGIAVLSLHDRD